ncbi:MAG: DNA polymerase III subunit chi [Desulfarculaceae bacterium]|nr:DNA polymerase III subunit chi [Desulfarculaceae bacterium]MCF8073851.1 DNA polymerase III subunit chi [Desulfarculaceae bacterium]MCF8102831.1 DNA polymerase III subunit chi [Desulfarculaceae bacterium]MCF8116275.1 DNA polymerase III subunit chi [Desulfarculaceae bacterium]
MGSIKAEYVNLRQARASLEQAAARLAAAHHRAGSRVLVLAVDQAQAELLDRALWSFEQNSFLPHAQAGGPDQAEEPILIATTLDNPNQATVLIAAAPLAELPGGFPHFIQLLPLDDEPGLQTCRECYRALNEGGSVDLSHVTSLP